MGFEKREEEEKIEAVLRHIIIVFSVSFSFFFLFSFSFFLFFFQESLVKPIDFPTNTRPVNDAKIPKFADNLMNICQ